MRSVISLERIIWAMRELIVSRKHFSVYFKLLERVRRKQEYHRKARGSSFGIAVNCDEHSVGYQSVSARIYLLECYMNNNIPQKHTIEIEIETYSKNKKMYDNKLTSQQGGKDE